MGWNNSNWDQGNWDGSNWSGPQGGNQITSETGCSALSGTAVCTPPEVVQVGTTRRAGGESRQPTLVRFEPAIIVGRIVTEVGCGDSVGELTQDTLWVEYLRAEDELFGMLLAARGE